MDRSLPDSPEEGPVKLDNFTTKDEALQLAHSPALECSKSDALVDLVATMDPAKAV